MYGDGGKLGDNHTKIKLTCKEGSGKQSHLSFDFSVILSARCLWNIHSLDNTQF